MSRQMLACLALFLGGACSPEPSFKPPPEDMIKEAKAKIDAAPKVPDLATLNTELARNPDGSYPPPWRERVECRVPGECTATIVNDITGEIASVDGKLQPGWQTTGNLNEVRRIKP